MAESTNPTPTPTPTSAPANAPQPKQYIKASADDNALEPDALRGSEHVLKDVKVQDDEADRRKAMESQK